MNPNLSTYTKRRLRKALIAALASDRLNGTVSALVSSFLVTGTYEHDPDGLLWIPASLLDYEVRSALRSYVEPYFTDGEARKSCRIILMWLRV